MFYVAPRAGAWIETPEIIQDKGACRVAPRAGAWIETFNSTDMSVYGLVAPRAGAWIETRLLLPSPLR